MATSSAPRNILAVLVDDLMVVMEHLEARDRPIRAGAQRSLGWTELPDEV
jgi:hypothetical protein